MAEIELLRADHAPALLTFELENRAYFAASVPDRGDAYFAGFDARHGELLAEQAAGLHFFHVLVDRGEVVGRVNLVDVSDGSADLGYRIAAKVAGRGVATAAVREVCERAATDYALTRLRAATTLDNPASKAVLTKVGFVPTGATVLSGRPGATYLRELVPGPV